MSLRQRPLRDALRLAALATALSAGAIVAAPASSPAASLPPPPTLATVQVTNAGHGTVTSAPAGIACGQSCSAMFAVSTTVTLTAAPDAGYIVTWSGACGTTTATTCKVTVDGDKAITATFARPTLSVSVQDGATLPAPSPRGWVTSSGVIGGTSSPAGIDCGDVCAAELGAGTMVTLWPIAFPGSVFARWEGNWASAATDCPSLLCTVTLTESKSVTAVFNVASGPVDFQTSFTVSKAGTGQGTVSSRPPGIACGPPDRCASRYPTNVNVTLTATPDSGSTFEGWGGPCAGAGTKTTCIVTVGPGLVATAKFDRISSPDPPRSPDPPSPPDPPRPPDSSKPPDSSNSSTITTDRVSVQVIRARNRRTITIRARLRVDAAGTLRLLRRGGVVLMRAAEGRAGPNVWRWVVPKRLGGRTYRLAITLKTHGGTQRLSWPVRL